MLFDTLTKDDLYALHSKFFREAMDFHKRAMALESVFCEEWRILTARHAEVSGHMATVYAEIDRRIAEADADA